MNTKKSHILINHATLRSLYFLNTPALLSYMSLNSKYLNVQHIQTHPCIYSSAAYSGQCEATRAGRTFPPASHFYISEYRSCPSAHGFPTA